MTRLKNLFTYLITNRQADLQGWADDYETAVKDLAAIRTALVESKDIADKACYAHTTFSGEADPWSAFARRHLYEKFNGVCSRGQSVLSDANFNQFIADADFRRTLAALIKQPDKTTFLAFNKAWETMCEKLKAGRNPLLVNRVLGACTLEVSSTANIPAFMTVYGWMAKESLLPEPKVEADWYDKNVQVMSWLRQEFSQELADKTTSLVWLSMFVWEMYVNIANPFSLKKQVIRYGAPGTGKTFTALRDTELLWKIWREKYGFTDVNHALEECRELVQFHPSYGYEDFIEGLRPVLGQDKTPTLKLQNGHFKEFCRRAGKWEVEVCGIPQVGLDLAKRWPELTVGELRPHIGTYLRGKSWESIRTRQDPEKVAEIVPPFFFLIDEINRAELSRVLGELMLCLEYRGVGGAITTQYAALNTPETGMLRLESGYRFFIPHNVYVIGTMNTIDRSVESFDLALRRRFRWERIEPDIAALRYHLNAQDIESGRAGREWAKLADNLENLNAAIRGAELLGADYEIGHAYLMNLRYPATLTRSEVRENIWEDAIRPLLEEYLRGSGRAETLFASAFGLHQ